MQQRMDSRINQVGGAVIVVITEETDIADLTRTMRRGGYVLKAKPGGIFELVQINRGLPTCELCNSPASVQTATAALCSKHAAAQIEKVTP
jgi:hypothetical protein